VKDLTDGEIYVLKDVIDEIADRLRHYSDGEMGWDADNIADFHNLWEKMSDEAKRRKFWWAR
jgi:hypothetical protein